MKQLLCCFQTQLFILRFHTYRRLQGFLLENCLASPLLFFYIWGDFSIWLFGLSWFILQLKIIPINKWLLFTLALLPLSIFIASSLSADAFTNGISFLLISYIFKIAYTQNSRFGLKETMIIAGMAMLLAFSKTIYFFITFLIFIIPISKTGSLNKYLTMVSVTLVACILASGISSLIVGYLSGQVNPIEQLYGLAPGIPLINPSKQIAFILSDLPGFMVMIFKSFSIFSGIIIKSYIGCLGWMELYFSNIYYLFAIGIIIIIAFFGNNSAIEIKPLHRIIFLSIIGLIILSFSFTMYCSWAEPGANLITNMQGRYFIPAAPLLLFIWGLKRVDSIKEAIPFISMVLVVVSFVVTIYEVLLRYYL